MILNIYLVSWAIVAFVLLLDLFRYIWDEHGTIRGYLDELRAFHVFAFVVFAPLFAFSTLEGWLHNCVDRYLDTFLCWLLTPKDSI